MSRTPAPIVMVVLGTTIHEFASRKRRSSVDASMQGHHAAPVLVDPHAEHEDDGGVVG
jgi:hypothetical protein